MIKVQYVSEIKGAGKYASCLNCAKSSKDDVEMVRITIGYDRHNGSFCLCSECRRELYEKI